MFFSAKPHLLNILWNWDPDSAQMIKDIETINKSLFEKKVMEAANEIQKKEIKLLSEHQLRIRARVLDENVIEQNKYFIKNDIFDPADFPNHDFSYLSKPKEEESEDENVVLIDDSKKTRKMKILEAGIINMLKSGEECDIIEDEDTALASLGICKTIVKKIEDRFLKCKNPPQTETVEKLNKIKHFFNNLLIIQQILDVYPSTAGKDSTATSRAKQLPAAPESVAAESVSRPAAFLQPAAFTNNYSNLPELSSVNPREMLYPAATKPPALPISKDPRRSKQVDTGYSLYSTSIDQAGIEWYRQNKLS